MKHLEYLKNSYVYIDLADPYDDGGDTVFTSVSVKGIDSDKIKTRMLEVVTQGIDLNKLPVSHTITTQTDEELTAYAFLHVVKYADSYKIVDESVPISVMEATANSGLKYSREFPGGMPNV